MSPAAKAFFALFILLAIGALAHDIYIWHNSNGFPFEFAALGWIAKTYYPNELQVTIDTLSPETFNMLLTPILKIPAFFLMIGMAAFIFVFDFVIRKIKDMNPGRGKDRDQRVKLKRYQ